LTFAPPGLEEPAGFYLPAKRNAMKNHGAARKTPPNKKTTATANR
jgi:hypothetical protein